MAYYYSSGTGSWVYGAVIAGIVLVVLALIFLLGYCRRKKRLQQQQAAMQAQTQMGPMPSYPVPQYATPYAPTPAPMGYPPPMNGGGPPHTLGQPAVWYNNTNRSLDRADMEAMSPEQLAEMGGRMGLRYVLRIKRTLCPYFFRLTHTSGVVFSSSLILQ